MCRLKYSTLRDEIFTVKGRKTANETKISWKLNFVWKYLDNNHKLSSISFVGSNLTDNELNTNIFCLKKKILVYKVKLKLKITVNLLSFRRNK